MRPQSAGFPNGSKTRVRRTGCGVEQFLCRRRARQHPISCAGWGGSPTQQWEEFPESPRAAPAPVRRGDGGNSRPTGCGNGLRRRPRSSRLIMRRGVRVAPGASPSGTGDRDGAGRCARRTCGAGAPHRHAATGLRRDAGWEHPAHRRKPIRMDGGIRRFGDARPTARWCNGSTPALWREVRVRIPRRAPTPIRSALRRSHKGREGSAVRRRNPHGPFPSPSARAHRHS